MINLKANENKAHKIPLSNFFLSQIVKDVNITLNTQPKPLTLNPYPEHLP